MTTPTQVSFRDLDATESNRLLMRNHVGRIAYSFRDRVDIEPISYIYADGRIYIRTAPGSKLTTLSHAPWVAFEVDEVTGPHDWRSVVVHGTVYVLEDRGSEVARESYRRAVGHLRTLMPQAFGDSDPTPERTVVMQLHPDTITGREARPVVADREAPTTTLREAPSGDAVPRDARRPASR
ncbi:MAG TPA: pyridoxamine 5'-phosphate oxidase family protein [Gemmatimonadaceae bacterium]|jgi:nitroimidazol reductase NimA-like FMN-containing flavoprotein (pyridoxamine 5'-phosphate oxidase superfamily)|nr:pyridoxamine 5'-phosphate oxidase family protein [Gemmatimonadaceae bacterium]